MVERGIRVVISDVDGTQVAPNRDGLPSLAVSTAAHQLRQNGVHLLEATSRSHNLLRKIVDPLDLRGNLCTLDGGATVAHANSGDVVWSQWLNADSKHAIVAAIGSMCAKIGFDQTSWGLPPHEVLTSLEANEVAPTSSPAIFAVFDLQKGNSILQALAGVPHIRHTPVMWYDKDPAAMGCLQVNDQGVDKQSGIQKMLELAGLAGERVLAIGDGTNDLPLFAAVDGQGIKVAMGNACDELKDLADWIAPSVTGDGFAVAMDHFGLT